jgi:hypothetical protein
MSTESKELELIYDIKACRQLEAIDKRAEDDESFGVWDQVLERVRVGLLRSNPDATLADAESAIDGLPIFKVREAIECAISGETPGKKN